MTPLTTPHTYSVVSILTIIFITLHPLQILFSTIPLLTSPKPSPRKPPPFPASQSGLPPWFRCGMGFVGSGVSEWLEPLQMGSCIRPPYRTSLAPTLSSTRSHSAPSNMTPRYSTVSFAHLQVFTEELLSPGVPLAKHTEVLNRIKHRSATLTFLIFSSGLCQDAGGWWLCLLLSSRAGRRVHKLRKGKYQIPHVEPKSKTAYLCWKSKAPTFPHLAQLWIDSLNRGFLSSHWSQRVFYKSSPGHFISVFLSFQSVYSRVARVCKNDKGGPNKFSNRWAPLK